MYINSVLEKKVPACCTEKEIETALYDHYGNLAEQIKGVAEGRWHLVVNGPTGSGKTEFVKKTLDAYCKTIPTFNSGALSAVMLFKLLYENRRKGDVLVIDDTDSIFESVEAVEVLKAALDTQTKKTVEWNKYSQALSTHGVPTTFAYSGKVIIITNRYCVRNPQGAKNKVDRMLLPLWSRVMYFAAGLPTRQWEMQSVKMFHQNDEIRCFAEKGIDAKGQKAIINFVDSQQDEFHDVSFRLISQISDLYLAFNKQGTWKQHALNSLT